MDHVPSLLVFKMAASAPQLLFGFVVLLACSLVESAYPVPVFLWSKDSHLNDASPVLAGHTIKEKDFQEIYLHQLFQVPQTICVFLQDRLSVDDISHYGDAYSTGSHGAAFSNLKVAMETANSTAVLPSVEISSSSGKPNELVQFIRKMASGLVVEFQEEALDSFSINKYSLDKDKTNVFIFHLHQTSSSTPMEVFSQNDKLMGGITGQVASSGLPYTCIFTAVSPSKAVYEKQLSEERSAMAHDRLRRDVAFNDVSAGGPQTPKNGSALIDGKCILMYFKGFTVKFENVSFEVLNSSFAGLNYVVTPHCPSANSTAERIDIVFQNIPQVSKFNLSMTFNASSRGEWQCLDVVVYVDGTFGTDVVKKKIEFGCKELSGPTEFSYHCNKVALTNTENKKTVTMIFAQFQIQPYGVNNGTFSYAYDCVGFFTIPIFMGLITAGILLLILFIGILALFSLTTMDRFDDPKGPTIQVATG